MAKIIIELSEGPKHEQKIEINGPVKSGDHFIHEGFTYRVINNGQYAQCCGRAAEPEAKPRATPKKSKAKAKPAKKPTAPAA